MGVSVNEIDSALSDTSWYPKSLFSFSEFLLSFRIFPFIKGHPKILASPYEFERDPQSGMEISELMPELRKVSNEICMIRSMHTEQFNHAPAQMFIYTGSPRFGRPSMGSWLTWGLGSGNTDVRHR